VDAGEPRVVKAGEHRRFPPHTNEPLVVNRGTHELDGVLPASSTRPVYHRICAASDFLAQLQSWNDPGQPSRRPDLVGFGRRARRGVVEHWSTHDPLFGLTTRLLSKTPPPERQQRGTGVDGADPAFRDGVRGVVPAVVNTASKAALEPCVSVAGRSRTPCSG
jgi:hypothetical protein